MQVRTLEQGKTIEELENAVNKLAKSKHKTSAELHDLKNEMVMTENDTKQKKARSSQTMQQINSELQTTKHALEESRVREKQVNTFIVSLFSFGEYCPRQIAKYLATDASKLKFSLPSCHAFALMYVLRI